MKYVSDYKELSGITYDTPEACQKAEADVDARKAKAAAANEQKRLTNKKYDDAIAAARENLKRARNALKDADGEAKAIADEANEKIRAVMCPARKNVRDAERALAMAIADYNKNIGPYQINVSNLDVADVDVIVRDILKGFWS